MKTRGVSQSKSQGWNWGLGQDPGVSTNRAPEDLLRLVPPSAQQWHPCARSVLFSTQARQGCFGGFPHLLVDFF